MSIVTKTGDKGETSLMYGRRVSKSDARVDAYGCLDELTAALGLVRAFSKKKFLSDEILAAQRDLIVVMGELATAPNDRERYVKDGFQLTTKPWLIESPASSSILRKINSFIRKTGRSLERQRFRLPSILRGQRAVVPNDTSPSSWSRKTVLTLRFCVTSIGSRIFAGC